MDRIIIGAVAGSLAGIIQTVYGIMIEYVFRISEKIYDDYAMMLMLGKVNHDNLVSVLIGILGNIINTATLGILLSYIVKWSGYKHHIFKGFGLGLVVWMFFMGLATLYRLPEFAELTNVEALVLLGGAIIWGSLTGTMMRYIDLKQKNIRE